MFIAAPSNINKEKMINTNRDQFIVDELKKIGLEIGAVVIGNNNFSLTKNRELRIVGYDELKSIPIVSIIEDDDKENTGIHYNYRDNKVPIHSNYKYLKNAFNLHNAAIMSKDKEVDFRLGKLGFKVGDKVICDNMIECGIVIGINGTRPVVCFEYKMAREASYFDIIHSKYNDKKKQVWAYNTNEITKITEDKVPELTKENDKKIIASKIDELKNTVKKNIEEELKVSAVRKEIMINEGLSKLGFRLGQWVVGKVSPQVYGKEMRVIGFDDKSNNPILHFTNEEWLGTISDDNINNVSKNYKNYASEAFILNPDCIMSKDEKILFGLEKLGFKIDSVVKYSAANNETKIGRIVGYNDKHLIISCEEETIVLDKLVNISFGSEKTDMNLNIYKEIIHSDYSPNHILCLLPSEFELGSLVDKSTSNNNTSQIKNELKKVGYRVAANQSVKLTQNALVSLLNKNDDATSKKQALSSSLSTEYGKALVSMILGLSVPHMPLNNYPKAADIMEKMAKEFRAAGMTTAGNELAETIFKSALEVLSSLSKEEDNATIINSTIEENHKDIEYEITNQIEESRVAIH